MNIRLDCGHFCDHKTPESLRRAPDTVIGVGIKPPKKCPKCVREDSDD
jgi:hypothetical protein